MRKYFKRLWERERPSADRARRKDALRVAKNLLDIWADYGNPADLRAAILTLEWAQK